MLGDLASYISLIIILYLVNSLKFIKSFSVLHNMQIRFQNVAGSTKALADCCYYLQIVYIADFPTDFSRVFRC